MDADMHFGELAEEKPRPQRRPDADPRFAVVPCGQVADGDLNIFAELDCLLDMEAHALSNPNVELGGVMLGGQFTDDQGRSFVVVNESLRAEHYESTRGSFKFTHDTWSDITRRLETYPADTRMVGWYHTHPDWGVFLSGMDLFICDHFFNKPLDLALVIDPCRQDRGWFQWTGRVKENPRRTGGFYLYSSRFRREELEHYAQALEGSDTMPTPQRSNPQSSGAYGAPVVNVVGDRSPWPMVAILGMLTLQSVLVFLLVWQSLRGSQDNEVVALLKSQRLELEYKTRRETLDDLAQQLAGTKDGFVTSLETKETELKRIRTELDLLAREEKSHADELKENKVRIENLEREREILKTDLKKSQIDLAEKAKQQQEAEKIAAESGDKLADSGKFDLAKLPPWAWAVGMALLTTLGMVGLWFYQARSASPGFVEEYPRAFPAAEEKPPEPSKDAPEETNT